MKSIFLGSLIVLLAGQAFAVSDKFQCTFEVVDLASGSSAKSTGDKYMLRMPGAGGPDYSVTAAQTRDHVSVRLPHGDLSGTVDMYYKHALKPLGDGTFDARQLTCVGVSLTYCKNTTDSSACSSGHTMCYEPNPYDPVRGWKKTMLSPGGTPIFDASNMTPSSAEMTYGDNGEKAVVNFDCKFQGTFN